ncbi:STAS domain-containing protein [Streptomyces sp. NPDC049813]|uniref:STAS domain-containing protein n=1 Tax=Streptomyces sp. NPDC049813 TaxID=3365597 RepID=UPI00378B2A79
MGIGREDRGASAYAAWDGAGDPVAVTVLPFTLRATLESGAARVSVEGELDAITGPYVLRSALACLAEGPTGVCLDLAGVSFCDCAGLNALLAARLSVLADGRDFAVEGIGPRLERLLFLIGAEGIFTARGTPADAVPAPRAPAEEASPSTTSTTTAPGECPPRGFLA